MQIHKLIAQRNGCVVLWGTGDVAKALIEGRTGLKESIHYMVDGNNKLWGKWKLLDMVIHNPELLYNKN